MMNSIIKIIVKGSINNIIIESIIKIIIQINIKIIINSIGINNLYQHYYY